MQMPPMNAEAGPSTLPTPFLGYTFDTPSESSARPTPSSGSSSTKRSRTGCHTCRVRKKRCDEAKPHCATCQRLGVECLGYDKHRPLWLRGDDSRKKVRDTLKHKIKEHRISKLDNNISRETTEIEAGVPGTEEGTNLIEQFLNSIGAGQGSDAVFPTVDTRSSFTSVISDNPFEQTDQGHMDWSTFDDNANIPMISAANQIPLDTTLSTLPQNTGNSFEDVWTMIFGQPPTTDNIPLLPAPSPTIDNSLLSFFSPTTSIPSQPEIPDLTYLHHYLNVVLPLQYRFVVKAMADLVAPLALSNPEVLQSISSLAALHLAANRAKDPMAQIGFETDNEDQQYAIQAHRQTIEKLRFVSAEELTSEEVVLPSLFAISYYLFMGGTAKDWADVLKTSRRCLSAALTQSPELVNAANKPSTPSPWQRYRPLITAMVWMDIVGSVSQNKASRLLPMYRRLLGQSPAAYGQKVARNKLSMERVMGCDDTTFLALAETVALSEWRDHAESQGELSLKELLSRAAPIEKILDERSWRENTLDSAAIVVDHGQTNNVDMAIIPVLSEIFYGAAKVLLASVVHGPFPRVPEIADAVQETAEALYRLDLQYPNSDVNRSLIFPITIAGCHAVSPSQQTFFKNRFAGLGAEAAAFGNSKQALELLEEVWKRRLEGGKEAKVCWRKTMMDLGWESGILLI